MEAAVNLVNLAVAFGAGVISITSPCCLPLLPGYLGYLTGMSSGQLEKNRGRTLAAALLFVAGFSVVFISLGATASVVGALLLTYRLPLAHIAGVFIAVMGLLLLLEGRIGLLSRGGDWSRWFGGGKLWTAPLLGAAFAITWTPCIGPVLGAILTLAGSTAALSQGVALLAAYSLGLAVPFVALSLSVPRVHAWLRAAGRGPAVVQAAAGVLLVGMGVLLVTDRWLPLVAPVLSWYAQARWPPV
ncbi:MAG TPA: cytochrome c biogenesis protein CcdA [Candidatus Acidoferrales bacterium]|nr:cytochrome c biogenesis protein CcdA [Candidatus Acidoferrales bacterium]